MARRRATERDIAKVWLRTAVSTTCGVDGLAKAMQCSRSTAYARLAAPDKLTLADIRQIAIVTGIPADKVAAELKAYYAA